MVEFISEPIWFLCFLFWKVIIYSTSLIETDLFRLFLLVWVLENCVFQRISLFHLVQFDCGLKADIVWLQITNLKFFKVFYGSECGLLWWMNLRKMCILLSLNEVVYKCPLCPVDWWYCWVPLCPHWFSFCWISPLLRKGCWKVSNYLVDSLISN